VKGFGGTVLFGIRHDHGGAGGRSFGRFAVLQRYRPPASLHPPSQFDPP
jgi:hypothetical protein